MNSFEPDYGSLAVHIDVEVGDVSVLAQVFSNAPVHLFLVLPIDVQILDVN